MSKQRIIGQPGDQDYLDRLRAYLQASPEARRRGAERYRQEGDLLAARATEEGRVTDLLHDAEIQTRPEPAPVPARAWADVAVGGLAICRDCAEAFARAYGILEMEGARDDRHRN